ncbi:MAG: hypothetical protein IJW99_07470, partial [Clostridia bacterium]|nr:hypothetical protein [Clostridia bacterium]
IRQRISKRPAQFISVNSEINTPPHTPATKILGESRGPFKKGSFGGCRAEPCLRSRHDISTPTNPCLRPRHDTSTPINPNLKNINDHFIFLSRFLHQQKIPQQHGVLLGG